MRKSTLFTLMVLAAACGDAPSAPTPDGGTVSSTPAGTEMEVSAAGQEPRIHALVDAGEAAWAAKDPAAYAALFAEDAEFISPLGTYLFGREAIRAQHVLLFGGPFFGSSLDIDVRRIRFLTGTIAVVDLRQDLTNYQFLPPGLVATSPGLLQVLVRWVVVKRGGDWEVIAHQVTQVQPAP